MYRSVAFLLTVCVLFSACKTNSVTSSSISLVKFGAGGIDTDSSVPNHASVPMGVKKIKFEETLAQVALYEADLDDQLSTFDYTGVFASFDSITDLLSSNSAGNAKMAEVRSKIEKSLDSIVFETVSSPSETVAGFAFKKDFSARIMMMANGIPSPLSRFNCTVTYPSIDSDGSKITIVQNVTSGIDGLITFTAPIPSVSGKKTLSIASSLTCKDKTLRDSIEIRKTKGQLSVTLPHVVASGARKMATTISILDFDKNGKAILSSNMGATTLLKPLVQKGFGRIGMADFQKELGAGDEEILLKAAKAQFGNGVQRFIFGTTRVESVIQGDDLLWSCTYIAQVSVWDFTLGSKIYTTEVRSTENAKTEAAAIDAARKKVCGELLVSDLYYNM